MLSRLSVRLLSNTAFPHKDKAGAFIKRCVCLVLIVLVLTCSVKTSYVKASGAAGIIGAAGTVTIYVALATLAVIAGVSIYNEVKAADSPAEFGQNLYDNWLDFVTGHTSYNADSVRDWLYNVSLGNLKLGEIWDSTKAFFDSIVPSTVDNDYVVPDSNTVSIGGTLYSYNDNIKRVTCGSGTLGYLNGVNAPRDWSYEFRNFVGDSPVYFSYYLAGSNSFLLWSSLSPFSYERIEVGYGSTQSNIQNSTSFVKTINNTQYVVYYFYQSFNESSKIPDFACPSSAFTDSTYDLFNIWNVQPKSVSLQAFLMVYGGFSGVIGDNDDVKTRDPSIVGGGLVTGENNDVITKGHAWELVNGGDVIVGENEIDLPSDITLDYPLETTLEDIIARYLAGEISWEEFLRLLGVIGIDPTTGWTIVQDPAISQPISEITDPINNPYPKPSPENAPFTFLYGLADKFPFCIPFDFIDLISVLSAAPEIPVFTVGIPDPKNMGSLVTTQISLEDYDNLAMIARDFEIVLFILLLLYITRDKMIKG